MQQTAGRSISRTKEYNSGAEAALYVPLNKKKKMRLDVSQGRQEGALVTSLKGEDDMIASGGKHQRE